MKEQNFRGYITFAYEYLQNLYYEFHLQILENQHIFYLSIQEIAYIGKNELIHEFVDETHNKDFVDIHKELLEKYKLPLFEDEKYYCPSNVNNLDLDFFYEYGY